VGESRVQAKKKKREKSGDLVGLAKKRVQGTNRGGGTKVNEETHAGLGGRGESLNSIEKKRQQGKERRHRNRKKVAEKLLSQKKVWRIQEPVGTIEIEKVRVENSVEKCNVCQPGAGLKKVERRGGAGKPLKRPSKRGTGRMLQGMGAFCRRKGK